CETRIDLPACGGPCRRSRCPVSCWRRWRRSQMIRCHGSTFQGVVSSTNAARLRRAFSACTCSRLGKAGEAGEEPFPLLKLFVREGGKVRARERLPAGGQVRFHLLNRLPEDAVHEIRGGAERYPLLRVVHQLEQLVEDLRQPVRDALLGRRDGRRELNRLRGP